MPPTQPFRLFALPAALALSAVLLSGCGGGSGGSGSLIKKADGETFAHSVVIKVGDLPGQGWQSKETDKFNDDQATPPGEACAAVAKAREKLKSLDPGTTIGRAQVKYAKPGPSNFNINTEVEETVRVFDTLATTDLGWKAVKDSTSGTLVEDCFGQALNAALKDSGGKATAKKGTPFGATPEGGFAVAADVTVTVGKDTAELHYEVHYWRHQNAGLSVSFSGLKSELTADIAKAALAAAEKNLTARAK